MSKRSSDVAIDGGQVRRLRRDRLLTQVELATKASITDRTLSQVELAGREARVTVSTARGLASALGVEVDDLRPDVGAFVLDGEGDGSGRIEYKDGSIERVPAADESAGV